MEPLDLPESVRTRRGTHARLVASDKAIEWIASVDADVDETERINEIPPARSGTCAPARLDRLEHHRAAAGLPAEICDPVYNSWDSPCA